MLWALVVLATVSIPGLDESSGVVASRRHPGVFWTHNDQGSPDLYAFDRAGKLRGKVRIAGADIYDWEDIAIGPGNTIYIGDIGDNNRSRREVIVYKVAEPDPSARISSVAQTIRMRYPDEPHDAEALLVHPKTGDIYIVTKARGVDTKTRVYRAAANARSPVKLKHIADIEFPDDSGFSLVIGRVTGGDISPDGTRIILCGYFRAWEARFDPEWKQPWKAIEIERRVQGEAICYRHDGKALILTSEGTSFPLIEVRNY